MLKPTFPAFFVISSVLDLTDDDSLCEAARLLGCIAIHVRSNLDCRTSNLSKKELTIVLDPNLYHLKALKDFFACTGNIQTSLFHFFKILTQLHRCPDCRELVVFPICVREYEDSIEHSSIVFPKLGPEYKIGLPDSPAQRERFFERLKAAVQAIHKAGVVHLDLYLSNIMWKELEDGDIELKIIDWDAAHFIADNLFPIAHDRISGSGGGGNHRHQLHLVAMKVDAVDHTDHSTSMRYYDISLIRALEAYADNDALASRTKGALDGACIEIQKLYINAAK